MNATPVFSTLVVRRVPECAGCEDIENAPHAPDCSRAVFDGKTASEWRAMATKADQDRLESMDRCDTDGYLSQWALQQMASRYRYCAEVAQAGGTIIVEAPVLIATGQVVKGEWITGEYGESFLAWETVEAGVRYYHPSRANKPGLRRTNDAKKGIEVHRFRVPARLNPRTGSPVADEHDWVDIGDTYDIDYTLKSEAE